MFVWNLFVIVVGTGSDESMSGYNTSLFDSSNAVILNGIGHTS